MTSSISDLWYRPSWRHFSNDLLSKRWAEQIIPFSIMLALTFLFTSQISGFATQDNAFDMSRSLAETGMVAMAISVTLIAGGIDLSVGAVFGLTNICCLILIKHYDLPVLPSIVVAVMLGALVGAINGLVVAYLRVRPFLATLVSLIIIRAVVQLLDRQFSPAIASSLIDNQLWRVLGAGFILGIPTGAFMLAVVAIGLHVILSRSRVGAHVTAVGASRKAARHAGIAVEWVLFRAYVVSGLLAGFGGVIYASRLESSSSQVGLNLEIAALTAAVLGGVSLSGGKGTVLRALIGTVIVVELANGLVLRNADANVYNACLAGLLLVAVGVDQKWARNRSRALQKIRVDPGILRFSSSAEVNSAIPGVWAPNDALSAPDAIGLGVVEGPEDVLLDREGRLYCGDRRGWIWRFSGPNFSKAEVFSRTGGCPLGMALDADGSIVVCVGGMGLYRVLPDGTPVKLTDETNRTWWELHDDSRLPLADDLDIAEDGSIYFTEATKRFEAEEWILDGMEGRKNGRLIRYDPRTGTTRTVLRGFIMSNGVATSHDRQSILIAETWACNIWRYWIGGPKKGQRELFASELPGYVDNINRSSDGAYWVALCGIRAPAYDLAMRMPEFRRRMMKRIPPDEWIYPGMNHGCVVKIAEDGRVLASLWDSTGEHHPTITSMREHAGYLYIGGLHNNRVGRVRLPEASNRCDCGQLPCVIEVDGADRGQIEESQTHVSSDVTHTP